MDNTKHFKEAVKVFTDKWNMDITTKYLRMITEDTNEKIKKIKNWTYYSKSWIYIDTYKKILQNFKRSSE